MTGSYQIFLLERHVYKTYIKYIYT